MAKPTGHHRAGSVPGEAGAAAVYFAKAPLPGLVKTRLCPPLTPAEAAGLYAGWLRDVLRPVPGARTLVYGWPEEELPVLAPYVPAGLELRAQQGKDLWERLRACFAELFAEGHGPVAVRNTDSPQVGPERVAEALALAGPGTIALGPDAGGGYYLVALAVPCPGLFEGMTEGGATVLASTLSRAAQLGLAVERLPEEHDVDHYEDLLALWRARLQEDS